MKRKLLPLQREKTGLVWDTNMAAVSLFWDTNVTEVTSCENALQLAFEYSMSLCSKKKCSLGYWEFLRPSQSRVALEIIK